MREVLLWTLMPVCAYLFVPFFLTIFMFLTPPTIHRSPHSALWAIFFAAFMVFIITDQNLKDVALALLVGVVYHFGKYWLLLQLSYDPILKVVLTNREQMIEDLKSTFHADAFSKGRA